MKEERFFELLTGLDDSLIEEASFGGEKQGKRHRRRMWISVPLAAVLVTLFLMGTAAAANPTARKVIVGHVRAFLKGQTYEAYVQDHGDFYSFEVPAEDGAPILDGEAAKDGSWGMYGFYYSGLDGELELPSGETVHLGKPDEAQFPTQEPGYLLAEPEEEQAPEHTGFRLWQSDEHGVFQRLCEPEGQRQMKELLRRLKTEFDCLTVSTVCGGSGFQVQYKGWFEPGKLFQIDQFAPQVNAEYAPGEYYTTLQAFEIDQRVNQELVGILTDGRSFEEADFTLEPCEKVPVLMGDSWKQYYSLGDTIDLVLFRDEPFTCEVVGFLPKDYRRTTDGETCNLNTVLILPFFELSDPDVFGVKGINLTSYYDVQLSNTYILTDGMSRGEQKEVMKKVSTLIKEVGLDDNYRADDLRTSHFGFYPSP